jgi:hypothetical protein
MGCGCNKSGVPERDRQRSCAAMCMVCIERQGQVCTIKGLPTADIIHARLDCPMNHHPDGAGVLVWLGVKWYGVPYPLRVLWPLLRRLNRWKPLSGPLPWCGCVKAWKDWYANRRQGTPPRA